MVKKKRDFNKVVILTKYNNQETIKVMKQSGKVIDALRDFSRKALMPGKRISKSGKVYWETRVNRSDMPTKRI